MKHCMVGGLAAMLMAGWLIASAPPASAGCLYGGGVASRCDGAIQPDGTWQRCVVVGGGLMAPFTNGPPPANGWVLTSIRWVSPSLIRRGTSTTEPGTLRKEETMSQGLRPSR
jgi:hypothetical protein